MAHIARLYVNHPLEPGATVPLDAAQAHRLFGVMRLGEGAEVRLFNGRDGEWRARVARAAKRGGALACEAPTAPLRAPPDLWLCFAPIKKDRTDFIVEKAAEMGAARILPIQTDHTNAERVRQDRLQAHAVAAAEQCGGTLVAEVAPLTRLGPLLDGWDTGRSIMFCDEGAAAGALPKRAGPWAVFIGPEGGWSEAERTRLRALGHTVSLGPRVLRADTAAVAALVLWQAQLGDWA